VTQLLSPEAVRAHGGRVTHAVWRGDEWVGTAENRHLSQALCGFVPAQWWAWTDEHVAATADTVTCRVCRMLVIVSGGVK